MLKPTLAALMVVLLETVALAQTPSPTDITPNLVPLYLLQAGAWGMLWYVLWFVTHDGKEMLQKSIDAQVQQAVSNNSVGLSVKALEGKIDALAELTGRRIEDEAIHRTRNRQT